jgi:hypothetical protein
MSDNNTKNTTELIENWNKDGRSYITELNRLITKDIEEQNVHESQWPQDPRTVEQARSVISLVEREEREGRWCAENPIVDRAHEPFINMLDDVCQNLSCVCILGADEFLVWLGMNSVIHIRGAQVTERPDIRACAISRNRNVLLLVQQQGFIITRSLDGEPICHVPWPDGVPPQAPDIVQISDDERTIAFVAPDEEAWLYSGGVWTRVYPSAAFLEEIKDDDDDDDDENFWSDSMMHCSLSPDGRFIAYGSQCFGHFIDRITDTGEVKRWAEIGYQSEYPHYACFSDDSEFVALNSCHFYNGATVCVRLADVEGVKTEPYEEDERAPLINQRLRVYAATWLPQSLSGEKNIGAFALAGASYLDIVSADGAVLSTNCFGSSASSIDYCPKTGILAVASYSGFLHLFDTSQSAGEGKTIGYRPIRELYRWVLWRDRPPFRW